MYLPIVLKKNKDCFFGPLFYFTMTDYLHEVKHLVERLNLHPGDKRFQRSRARRDDKIKDKISDTTFSGHYGEKVIYRHTKQSFGKEFTTGSQVRQNSNSVGTSDRRISFYKLIKSNQDKCLNKNCIGGETNASTAESPRQHSGLHMKENVFQFSVEGINKLNEIEAIHSTPVNKKCGSRDSTASINSSLLSPIIPMQTEPPSPKNYGTWDKKHSRKNITTDKLKSPNPDQKSPSVLDPVFSENPTTITCRRNSGTNRPRLSESKSLPLSPAAYNAEKDAQQNGNFQYKLDTLRAELLAMRKADQELARRLLNLYSEIQVLKVKNSCMNYSELLDEAYYEAEMADEVPDMCDAPQKFTNKLLTSHGVTSFNIHSRRFSCS